MQKTKGTIVSIHFNKKSGRIIDEHDSLVSFDKKDLIRKIGLGQSLIGASVEFYSDFNNGSLVANEISLTDQIITFEHEMLVGKTFEGWVKEVVDYGVFIRFKDIPDGLLHKTDLTSDLKYTFKDVFTKGKNVRVIIKRVSENGIELKCADCIH